MKVKKKKVGALVLFSGGLDSILAVKILEKQGISVSALVFASYFFDADQAKKSAKENKIGLLEADFSSGHFRIVKNPRFGRGSGMNPCIDCHLLMLESSQKIAKRNKFDIIATGEVLGQRPMSQNIFALKLIEREAGLEGKILRPLSAKVLPETEYERRGLVERRELAGISGRSRKEQIALAKKYGIKYFPSPAGGCILTDKGYSRKLWKLLEKVKNPNANDLELLRIGRHFWEGRSRVILGRNHGENLKLKNIARRGDALAELEGIPGPLALVRGREKNKAFRLAEEMILKYAKKKENSSLVCGMPKSSLGKDFVFSRVLVE